MNELRKLDSSIPLRILDEISLTKLFLYGDSKFENKVNKVDNNKQKTKIK